MPYADITLGPESNPGAYVWSLVVNSNTVFAGGFFDAVNGESRPGLAALAADTGALLPWNPGVKGSAGTGTLIDYMAASDKAVFVVGEFKSIGGVYHPGFAMFAPEGAPRIVRQPVSQTVPVGETAQFSVEATGLAPLFYQWRFNGANLDGETATNLTIVNLQPEQAGHYDVVVSNSLGQVSSAIARLIASQPIGILSLSPSQTAPGGATVTLSVTATGSPPPLFQWRLNGVNIPGAVFSALTLPNLRPQDGGSYTVVVDNGSGAVISDVIELEVDSPTLPLVDNFADRVTTSSFAGVGMGTNTLATKENGEPNHANQTGGRSVWFSWQAPADGVAVFRTRGSGFDTVLAVYTNLTVDGTNLVAADDDQGGFLTSMVSFNAVSGMEYQIAIDGFAGASGNIVLTWNLQPGTNLIPIIFSQPQSQSVPLRSNYTFDALAAGQAPLRYQWYHNCLLIAGATNASLLLTNIQATDVGLYFVQVSNKAGTVQSESAFLELGPAPQTVSQDKLEDLLQADARSGALLTANKGRGPLSASSVSAFISVSAGAIGAQILDNTGATTQQGETNHCGVLGGASKWFGLQPVDEGVLLIDTIGSSIDTVLAVYTGTNLLNLREIACDNNSAPDGIRSLVRFTVVKGAKYCVVVDGVNGAQGNTSLNWRLGRAPASVPLVTTPSTVRLGGHLALSVTVTNAIPTPAYQWLWNGRIIPGGTASNLNLSNLQASQAGIYSVVASNFAGAITSTVAIVTIALPIQLSYEITQNNGRIQFRLMGPASTGLVMEASSDLMNWMPLFTNAAASLPLDFTEAPATNSPFRFYRVMPWP